MKKTEKIVEKLQELGYLYNSGEKEVTRFSEKSMMSLIKDFILPVVLNTGGERTRGWRIASSFMKLMAECGADLIREGGEAGEVLFELALQRIQCHPSLLSIDYAGILPAEYKKYSAAYDQSGLWNTNEWAFMQKMVSLGKLVANDVYRAHCRTLVLQILQKVSPISMCSGWFSCKMENPNKELFCWAMKNALQICSSEEIVDFLMENGNWRAHKSVLAVLDIEFEKLVSYIDLDEEPYYKGVTRWVLKLFGLYEKKVKAQILEELRKTERYL